MIAISSKAGTRLANAKFALDEHEAHVLNGTHDPNLEEIIREYESAADAVANELIANRHHQAEGD